MTIFDIRPSAEHARLQSVLDSAKTDRQTYTRGNWKHRKKNGDVIRVEIFSHQIHFNGRAAMLVLANDVTLSVELQEQLDRERNVRQQEVMRATVEMQEKARKEISNELHDNVNQLLGAAKLYLESGEPGEPLREEYRQESRAIIQTAIEEIRKLTRSLTPPMLSETGLIGAIEALILRMRKLESFGIHFRHEGFAGRAFDPAFELAAYRIVQEQTNNIIKYANATEISVLVRADERMLYITVSDNGIGFDTATTTKGVGFTNIINRSTVYQGQVRINAAPGKGCVLEVGLHIPLSGASLV
jgi:two-component system sensor histidine kinase UhpB